MSRFKDTSRWTQVGPTRVLDGDTTGGENGTPSRDLGFHLMPMQLLLDLEQPEARVGLRWSNPGHEDADASEAPAPARETAWSSLSGTATTRDRLSVFTLGHEGEPHTVWDRRPLHVHVEPLPEGFVRKRISYIDHIASRDLTDQGILHGEPGRLSWSPGRPEEREREFREERMYLSLYVDHEAWAAVLGDLLRSARPPARIRLSVRIELWEHDVDGFFNHGGEWSRDLGLLAGANLRTGASTHARLESLVVEFGSVVSAAAPIPEDELDDAHPASRHVEVDPATANVRAIAKAQERLATAVRRGSLLIAFAVAMAALWIGA